MKSLLVRISLMAFFLAIYFTFSWHALVDFVREGVAYLMQRLDYNISKDIINEELVLWVNNEVFYFTNNCTYVDLFAIAAPFSWIAQNGFRSNILKLILIAMLIIAINQVRIVLALHFYLQNIAWEYAHEIPDLIIHIITMTILVLPAIRHDLELQNVFAFKSKLK